MPPQFSCVPLRSTSENCAVLPCFSDFGYFPTAHFLTFPVRYYNPNATLFKDVEYRNPVLSGGFHADIQTVVFQKPICETVQVRIECAESLFLIVGLQAVCGRGDDGSNQECLVNIYTAAGWEYDFHNKTSSIIIARRMQGLNRQAINRC